LLQSVCSGSPFSFSVTGSGTPAPTYQWQKDGSDIGGATASSYGGTASPALAGAYRCVVTNACGTATSTAAALMVSTSAGTTDPSPQSVCAGSAFTFSVTGSGSPAPDYQW